MSLNYLMGRVLSFLWVLEYLLGIRQTWRCTYQETDESALQASTLWQLTHLTDCDHLGCSRWKVSGIPYLLWKGIIEFWCGMLKPYLVGKKINVLSIGSNYEGQLARLIPWLLSYISVLVSDSHFDTRALLLFYSEHAAKSTWACSDAWHTSRILGIN